MCQTTVSVGINPQHTHKYTHTCENRFQYILKIAALPLWLIKVRFEGLVVAAGEVKCLDLLACNWKDWSSMTWMLESVFPRRAYLDQYWNLFGSPAKQSRCVLWWRIINLCCHYSPARWAPGSTPAHLRCTGPGQRACPAWTGPAEAHGAPPSWWNSPLEWNRCSLGPAGDKEGHASVRHWLTLDRNSRTVVTGRSGRGPSAHVIARAPSPAGSLSTNWG